MRRIYLPVLLGNVEESRAGAFVALFTLESACRALLMTIVPLQAYALLRDAQQLSFLYLTVSSAGLAASLGVPVLMHAVRRRWMITIGALTYVLAAYLFSTSEFWPLVAALTIQIVATAMLEVTINLYMLDHVARRELNTFEPRRLLFSGTAFIIGPWAGVYLNQNVLDNLTFMIVAATALTLLGLFWQLRLGDSPAIQPAKTPPPNPLRYIPKFARQPRLLLAWALAVGRNGWWLMFFVYTPIFVTEAGYGPALGGALVSLGVGPVIFVRIWGRIGERIGIRRLLITGYALTGALTIAAGLTTEWAPAAMVLLVLAACGATIIDGGGNVPFLRAVHPLERGEMTSVYTTYRHATSLLTPALFALVLAFLPLPFVFVAGGIAMIGMAWLSGFLPKRL